MAALAAAAAPFSGDARGHRHVLHARCAAALGAETVAAAGRMRVLVVGLRGAGAEAAKALVLAGVGQVTVCDSAAVEARDLGANAFLGAGDLGRRRAEAARPRLARLNPYVDVQAHLGQVNEAFLGQFHAAVFCDDARPLPEIARLAGYCHARTARRLERRTNRVERAPAPVAVFVAQAWGASCSVFADFGPAHVVADPYAAAAPPVPVAGVDAAGRLRLDDGAAPPAWLRPGALVRLRGLGDALEAAGPLRVAAGGGGDGARVTGAPEGALPARGRGTAERVPEAEEIAFRPLADELARPTLASPADAPLHNARMAVWRFQEQTGALPRLGDRQDAARCVAIARDLAGGGGGGGGEVDEAAVERLALHCRAELPAFACLAGGLVAQEVLKVPGRLAPLRQWAYLEDPAVLAPPAAAGAAPAAAPVAPPGPASAAGTRYEHQVALLGVEGQARLLRQRWLVAGAGAVGCELVKGLALMGIGCGRGGRLVVVDPGSVATGDLALQDLVRAGDEGQPKAQAAAAAARAVNPDLAVRAYAVAAGPDAEVALDPAFWADLDGVCATAAWRYFRDRCVRHSRALVEASARGVAASVRVAVPHLTAVPQGGLEPPAAAAAVPHPYLPEHCAARARAWFDAEFCDAPRDALSLLAAPEAFLRARADAPARVERAAWLLERLPRSYEACVALAVRFFARAVTGPLRALARQHPRGAPFWGGRRRFPRVPVFSAEDRAHLALVAAAARLYADVAGVEERPDPADVRRMARDAAERDAGGDAGGGDAPEERARRAAASRAGASSHLAPLVMDARSDDTGHADFCAAAAAVVARARGVRPPPTRLAVKAAACGVSPLAPAAAQVAAGLAMLEVCKAALGRGAPAARNADARLGEGAAAVERRAPAPAPVMPGGATPWDRVLVDRGDLTLAEFLEAFPALHRGCRVQALGSGEPGAPRRHLWPSAAPGAAARDLLAAYVATYGPPPGGPRARRLRLDAVCVDADGGDTYCPPVYYVFSDAAAKRAARGP